MFLGACTYISKHIKKFAELAAPLSDLLKAKNKWKWEVEEQSAYDGLIEAITSPEVLSYFDPNKKTVVYTDSSKYQMGAVLMQYDTDIKDAKPVQLWAKKLNAAQTNYPIHELELHAIAEALKKFSWYLRGIPFTIYTDHKPLEYLEIQKKLTGRQIRDLQVIQQFRGEIKYIKGEQNQFADWLSRMMLYKGVKCPHCQELLEEEDHTSVMCESIKFENSSDEIMESMREDFYYDLVDYSMEMNEEDIIKSSESIKLNAMKCEEKQMNKELHDKITKEAKKVGNRWIVEERFVNELLKEFHSEEYRGHPGHDKMYNNIKKSYVWEGMTRDIYNHCRSCKICQKSKYYQQRDSG